MIFFDKVVQVLRLVRLNVQTAVGDQLSNGGRVGTGVVDGALAIANALGRRTHCQVGQLRASVDAASPDNQTDKGLRNEVEAVQVHAMIRCRWQLASQEADQFGSNKRRRLALRKMANAFKDFSLVAAAKQLLLVGRSIGVVHTIGTTVQH